MTETTTAVAPGLSTGTWTIDPAHSEVTFTIRHLMAKVRGSFTEFDGALTVGDSPAVSSVTAEIKAGSVTTRNAERDGHLRSADILDAENHPNLSFVSTGVRTDGDDFLVDGNLTIRDVTRPVTLELEFHGTGTDPWGGTRAGFSASTSISRNDFGVDFNVPLPGGDKSLLGDKVDITLEIEAVFDQGEQA